MADRISRKPDVLVNQCNAAAAGITTAGASWPTSAPPAAALTGLATTISGLLTDIATAESELRALRQTLAGTMVSARDTMAKVDAATDMLYGKDGAQKTGFGLDPRREATSSGTPEQVVIRALADGTNPASIFVDWDSVDGCVYEVQWFSDAPLTQMIGTQTVTSSELEIAGLTRGSQYWFRVRALRAGQSGPWSDQATRVANI